MAHFPFLFQRLAGEKSPRGRGLGEIGIDYMSKGSMDRTGCPTSLR